MIIKLTDKNGITIPLNTEHFVCTDPNTKPFTRVYMTISHAMGGSLTVKETADEIYELLTREERIKENLNNTINKLEETYAEEPICEQTQEIVSQASQLPGGVTVDKGGRYRENGVLIGKDRRIELGITA
jgi:hypothetical protein